MILRCYGFIKLTHFHSLLVKLFEKAPESTLKQVYTVSASIIFFLSLSVNIYFSGSGYFTVRGIQLSFLVVLILTIFFLTGLYFISKKLFPTLALRALIVHGILLRMCYTLFTDAATRTYDVYRKWGHLDYIKYIAQNFSLPPVNECQTYHPPLHHVISAVVLDISKLFTQKEFYQLKFIQLAMVLLSSLTLIFFYKILKELNCSSAVMLTAVSLFAFHPTNIYFSSRINNDNTMLFFYTLTLYFLVKWKKHQSLRTIGWLSISAASAILTKLSGIMLVPLIAVTFTVVFIRNRSKYTWLLKQYAIFTSVFVPLSASYLIRNHILFDQELSYVPSVGTGFVPTFRNLVFIPLHDILIDPFNDGGLQGGEFFIEFLLKSSLFGEWRYPGLVNIALSLIIFAVSIAIITLGYLIWANKHILKNYGYIFLLNLAIPVLLEMKFRTDFPVACSQDFRYAAPLLISVAYFLGKAVYQLKLSSLKILEYTIIACTASFCILSTVFVLSLGYYH